jgi:flavin-dependent dehydrogenase
VAAITLGRAGGRALVMEESAVPRHKVCGEFYSPEVLASLESMGLASQFLARGPARVTHAELHFGKRRRRFALPETAWGMSRYAFDDLLLSAAQKTGATVARQRGSPAHGPLIWAAGRAAARPRGRRLFGFKAHFTGRATDAVELYFWPGGYCGLNPIEGGRTNVCGLSEEGLLRRHGFRIDRVLLSQAPELTFRLGALERITKWYLTGPLRYGSGTAPAGALAAGDAGCFVDPFTGTGLLAALESGISAGQSALRALQGQSWEHCCHQHRRRSASFYRRQTAASSIIRSLLHWGWAESLAELLPGEWLFRLTRPTAHRHVVATF